MVKSWLLNQRRAGAGEGHLRMTSAGIATSMDIGLMSAESEEGAEAKINSGKKADAINVVRKVINKGIVLARDQEVKVEAGVVAVQTPETDPGQEDQEALHTLAGDQIKERAEGTNTGMIEV